ncbi:helix-turn-helix domain-containing protein [Pseudonocardia oroxyli]|uniref:Transcriptional regulator, CdaR family n=1 Tax=Pseudonocardia oroxyli TaxID=366584 RepID=A0A1G8DX39_PSEOR|nr:helix-turn-helix domain-containing protein [Pseudonocardia oroxyli]SDH62131.1 transcriptional regulator, CdaR family [Pseudonocardia oroxyli]
MIREDDEDWSAVERVCRTLEKEISTIATTVTNSIRAALPVYAVVPESEHHRAVVLQLCNRLHALAGQRGLNAGELETATDLATERASLGVPIDALIAAYQTADAAIWQAVVARMAPPTTQLLPRIGTLMFDAVRETTAAMAGAHSRVARAIDGDRIALAHRFLECVDDPAQQSAASVIAARLGFEPAGGFTGLVWQPEPAIAGSAAPRVTALSAYLGAAVISRVVAGGGLEMVTQGERVHEVLARGLLEEPLKGRWGVGVTRSGTAGARESLRDARLVLACTSARLPVRTFTRDWHEAVVLAERARLGVLLASAVEVAAANPHLAETVLAFAAADMSVAATAPDIHLHANSVTYRLERWERLTGLDARSFTGLSRSVVVCRLAELDREGLGRDSASPEGA